jgi:hypothetical protein
MVVVQLFLQKKTSTKKLTQQEKTIGQYQLLNQEDYIFTDILQTKACSETDNYHLRK